MKLEKIIYYLTPALLYKIYSKIKLGYWKDQVISGCESTFNFSELREKIGLFFGENPVEKFCDAIEFDQRTNQSVNCRNKENQEYLNHLILNGYCVIRQGYSAHVISQWREKSLNVMTDLGKRCDELRDSIGIESMQDIL